MARKRRIEYPGALHHVTSRGDHGEAVFWNDQDRRTFLTTVAEARETTGCVVHASVFKGTHGSDLSRMTARSSHGL